MKKIIKKPIVPQANSVRVKSDFPKHTLEEALAVAEALEEKHGGQPLPPTDTAIALDISPGSSDFRLLLSSSIKYGLTSGSYNQERVSLTDLGRRIVEPVSADDRSAAQMEAAFSPPTFRAIYNFLRGKKLPEDQFFQNTLTREFEVPRERAAICAKVILANVNYLGLVRAANTGNWLASDALKAATQPIDTESETNLDEVKNNEGEIPEAVHAIKNPMPTESRKINNAIFIGHGRNKVPLEQLKDLLNQYKIPFHVAVEEANGFRPISQKVADVMKECGAAILIFTAENEFKDAQGNTIWKPGENAIYELGAASVLYGNKIVLFKEASVDFPTNFRDIGYITFDKDQLAAKANDLFKELISFGLIKITVGG
jgi:predicted nucleotide-binding protein